MNCFCDPVVRCGVVLRLRYEHSLGVLIPIEVTILMLLMTRPRMTLSMAADAAEFIHRT